MLQTAVPEAMIQPDLNEYCFTTPSSTQDYDALGIGPGLSQREETIDAFLLQLESIQTPLVLDADALNILSENQEYLKKLPPYSVLTPHPRELERLVGKCTDSYERLQKAIELATTVRAYIILKGAYSIIISPDGHCAFNSTGNPGMATAGSGDVLTGVVLALLAQGYPAEDAATIATYVHAVIVLKINFLLFLLLCLFCEFGISVSNITIGADNFIFWDDKLLE